MAFQPPAYVFASTGGSDGQAGNELWTAGAGPSASFSSSSATAATDGGETMQAYVFAATNDEGGDQLWIAGPGLSNPRLLVDIHPGATGDNAFDFTQLGDGRVLFLADEGLRGRELWVTDGTEGGTHLVRDVRPGEASSLPDIVGMFGNQALFTVDAGHSTRELWVTDGTSAGTKMLAGAEFGKNGASLLDFNQRADGQWLFVVKDPDNNQDVWITDGTATGTHILADIPVMNGSKLRDIMLSPDGQDAYIRDRYLLWRTDGTAEGTALVGRGGVPLDDGKWLYLKNLNGSKYATFHITDGTEEGTHALFQSAGSYDVVSFGDGRSLIYAGAGLHVTDGTAEGTQRFFSGVSYYPSLHLTDFMSLGDGRILFAEMKGGLGTWDSAEVWVTDGTTEGTYQLGERSADMPKTLPASDSWLRLEDGSIVFSAPSFNDPNAVWKVDLTLGSIEQVEGISFSAGTTFHGIQLAAVPENGNHPASGALVFSEIDLVAGAFVSVSGVDIQDPDGWPNDPLLYRWYRDNSDGGWDEIPGNPPAGTFSAQFFLSDADVGHRLKVSAHFLDHKGHLETITSDPSEVVKSAGTSSGPSEPHHWSEQLPLFDITYYLQNNPDVTQSGMDPLDHFLQFGGQEGRSPNADFDSAFYLSQNPDVADSGMNPFLHYLAYGWQEGRMASARNDFQAAHPELGSPELTAIVHGLLAQQAESQNPGTGQEIPPVEQPQSPLVDAQFYYATYTDVAQAGIDPTEHYMTFGWHEGRDPDALFDTSYYLDHNADVAAAEVNPMEHYLAFGAKEGRDPSALFDTDAYLAHYADVANSGVNPLVHYLQHGMAEGREIFPV